ncbi:MAG: hypothetical protein HYZ72_18310, partial [Deltaproteobacteria bacterium]|nr:hypothetical protein [Deltaproteobacteria bacterium]
MVTAPPHTPRRTGNHLEEIRMHASLRRSLAAAAAVAALGSPLTLAHAKKPTPVADETGEAARASGPFNLVLEAVGGQVLGNAIGMTAPG